MKRIRKALFEGLALACLPLAAIGACSTNDEVAPSAAAPPQESDLELAPDDTPAETKCVVSDEFASCFESCQNAAVGPANLYIMFDSSLSMEENSKWQNATAALKAFFSDPGSAGLGVALRFFPDTGCDEQSCDVSSCSEPRVPLGMLSPEANDSHRAALISAIDDKGPFGGTPMHPALEGAIAWAQAQLAGETIQRPVVVLVTDGAPFGCHTDPNDVNNDIANLAALAEKAYAEHGILTYVVGLEGSWEWIVDKIAASGGTGKALLVSNEQTYDELFAALQAIKESHVDCEVGLPPDSDLSELDPQTVNVTYTPGSGSQPITLQQVDGAAACGEGWYYDDPVAPTKIALCPETCALIQADKSARLDVLVGCLTQIAK